jgi:hypothetical protein
MDYPICRECDEPFVPDGEDCRLCQVCSKADLEAQDGPPQPSRIHPLFQAILASSARPRGA